MKTRIMSVLLGQIVTASIIFLTGLDPFSIDPGVASPHVGSSSRLLQGERLPGAVVTRDSRMLTYKSSYALQKPTGMSLDSWHEMYPLGVTPSGMILCFGSYETWNSNYQEGLETECFGFGLRMGSALRWTLPANAGGAKRRKLVDELSRIAEQWAEQGNGTFEASKLDAFGEAIQELYSEGLWMTVNGVIPESPFPNVLDIGRGQYLFHGSNAFDNRFWVLGARNDVRRIIVSEDFPGASLVHRVQGEADATSSIDSSTVRLFGCDNRGMWEGGSRDAQLTEYPVGIMSAYDSRIGGTSGTYTLLRSLYSNERSELLFLYEAAVSSTSQKSLPLAVGPGRYEVQLSIIAIKTTAHGASVRHRRIAVGDFPKGSSDPKIGGFRSLRPGNSFAWFWGDDIGIQAGGVSYIWDLETDEVSQLDCDLGRVLGCLSTEELLVVSRGRGFDLENLRVLRFE